MPFTNAFPIALILSFALTPLAIRLAWAVGFLDHPEARKLHLSATALLGGAGVFTAACAASLIVMLAPGAAHPGKVVWLLGGGLIAFLVGLWDDRFGMAVSSKLAGQVLAASTLIVGGLVPDLHLGPILNATVMVLGMVALMNAVNFLDNMNGMVAGLSAIALGAFAIGSAIRGEPVVAVFQLALAGACVGFMPYNYPKADVFLGDAGSLLLGYSLGASAVLAFEGGPQGWGQLGPLIALGYPAFDMIFVVITRARDGRKVYLGGRDHTNHRLASVLKCPTKTVPLLWASGAVLSVSGLAVQSLNQAIPALLLSALWMALFLKAGTRLSSVPIEAAPMPLLPMKSSEPLVPVSRGSHATPTRSTSSSVT
ncbi:MAG TPA: MraY family glycosyltransferase [Candidatus Eisenbacteria bacterium]|nr:MraY family glycosyltransferase [Candidatus Eisenbacteria bacterium]